MQVLYEVLFVTSDYSIDFSLRIIIFIVFQLTPPAIRLPPRCIPGSEFALNPGGNRALRDACSRFSLRAMPSHFLGLLNFLRFARCLFPFSRFARCRRASWVCSKFSRFARCRRPSWVCSNLKTAAAVTTSDTESEIKCACP